MSSEERTSPSKRTFDEAGFDNLRHPRPMKINKRAIFQEQDDEELAMFISSLNSPSQGHRDLSTILEDDEMSSSPTLPPLPTAAMAKEKSPSPDYAPSSASPLNTSPPSSLRTSQVIGSDVFDQYEEQRKIDEEPRQKAEEMIFNGIASFKALNNGKLSLTMFELLQKEVRESVYSKIPVSISSKKAAAATSTNADAASQTELPAAPLLTVTPLFTNAATQAELPAAPLLTINPLMTNASTAANNNDTVNISKPSYSNGSAQTDPPVIPTAATPTPASTPASTPAPAPAPIEPDWASIYDRELSTIRMTTPFVASRRVITVKTRLRPVAKPAAASSANRVVSRHASTNASFPTSRRSVINTAAAAASSRKASAPTPRPSSTQVISVDDSDDDIPSRRYTRTRTGGCSLPASKATAMQTLVPFKLQSGHAVRLPADLGLYSVSPSQTSVFTPEPSIPAQASDPVCSNVIPTPEVMSLVDDFEDNTSHATDKDDVPSNGGGSTSSRVGGGRYSDSSHYYGDQDGNSSFDGRHSGHYSDNGNNYGGDDGEDHSYFPIRLEDKPTFYGMTGYESHHEIDSALRFQDRAFNAGSTPTPNTGIGLRLRFQEFLGEVGAKHMCDPEVKIRKYLDQAWGPRVTIDEDTAVKENWCGNPSTFDVAKGYPLVEDVEFIVQRNNASPAGDCYWRAIAFLLYGTNEHWDLVKAEHLAYVQHVLKHPGHARHQSYTEDLNRKFFSTSSATADGAITRPFRANLWQSLHLAHAWTPGMIQQVTADLYNICVIMFTREGGPESSTITETAVRGSHNSRHVFLQFVNGNHFQPMCPNNFRPSEFRYPLVTVDKTAKYSNAPRASSNKTSLQHPWRNDFTKEVPAPVPHLHGCDTEGLRHWLGSK